MKFGKARRVAVRINKITGRYAEVHNDAWQPQKVLGQVSMTSGTFI